MPSRREKQWRHHEENKTMRKVRKQIKRNRKTKRTRTKDWLPDSLDVDALDDLDLTQDERVMPRGERERRQTVLNEALTRIREQERTRATRPAPLERRRRTPRNGDRGQQQHVPGRTRRADPALWAARFAQRRGHRIHQRRGRRRPSDRHARRRRTRDRRRGPAAHQRPRPARPILQPSQAGRGRQCRAVADRGLVAQPGLLACADRPLPDRRRTEQPRPDPVRQQGRPGGRRGRLHTPRSSPTSSLATRCS